MIQSGPGVNCGAASGLDKCGSGLALNVNSLEDAGEDVTFKNLMGPWEVKRMWIKKRTHTYLD